MAEEAVIKGILPHDKLAEQAVIGSLLLNPNLIMGVTSKLRPEDFYEKKYNFLFKAITELNTEGRATDIVTVNDRVRTIKGAESIINPGVIAEVMKSVITTIDFDVSSDALISFLSMDFS